MKTAVLFGASGFVGSCLLDALLRHPDYQRVIAVVRRPLPVTDAKLTTLIADFHSLPAVKSQLAADEIFIALGTTKKKSPRRADYERIDHHYPVLAATLAQQQGAGSVFLVSAVGADPESSLFYTRTKGNTERDILALHFAHSHLFRPSMILGQRQERRPLEKGLIKLWRLANPLLQRSLNKYRGLAGDQIARAMVNAAQRPAGAVTVYHWAEMTELLTDKPAWRQ